MFLLLVIILVIVVIVSLKPNQKTQSEIVQIQDGLPKIHLKSRGMSGLVRALNLAFEGSKILNSFTYENGIVTLQMQNGSMLKAHLSQIEVSYDANFKRNLASMSVKTYNKAVKVITYDNFNKHEWNVILRTMALAGKTYGSTLVVGTNVNDIERNIQKIRKELEYID